MSDSTTVLLVATEGKTAIERLDADAELEDKFRAAAKVAATHWLAPSDDEKFKGAVGALLMTSSEEDKARIEAEMRSLNTLSALLSGIPVDMERVDQLENPIGLMKLWREEVGEK